MFLQWVDWRDKLSISNTFYCLVNINGNIPFKWILPQQCIMTGMPSHEVLIDSYGVPWLTVIEPLLSRVSFAKTPAYTNEATFLRSSSCPSIWSAEKMVQNAYLPANEQMQYTVFYHILSWWFSGFLFGCVNVHGGYCSTFNCLGRFYEPLWLFVA